MIVVLGSASRASSAISRCGAIMLPSMRVYLRPLASRWGCKISRKDVHCEKTIVLLLLSFAEASRIWSRASTLLLHSLSMDALFLSWSCVSGWFSEISLAGLTVVVARESSSARHMGHLCWVSMTRSMQGVQKMCAHFVMTGSRMESRQIGQSSCDSIDSCSIF